MAQKLSMKIFLTIIMLISTITSAIAGEQVTFYHTDHVGTPLAMTDSTGSVIWQADYKPFGEEHTVTGTAENKRRFVGKEKDTESGLSYFDARYEDAKTGRFISVDPVGAVNPQNSKTNEKMLASPQRLNSYAYSLNNPVKFTDPSGLDSYRATRQIGSDVPSDSLLSHTFIYTTNPDGSIKHTYTWGNKYDSNGNGLWTIDSKLDITAAKMIYPFRHERGDYLGDANFDATIDSIVRRWQETPNPSLHKHGGIYNNCKTEASRLTREALKILDHQSSPPSQASGNLSDTSDY